MGHENISIRLDWDIGGKVISVRFMGFSGDISVRGMGVAKMIIKGRAWINSLRLLRRLSIIRRIEGSFSVLGIRRVSRHFDQT